MPDRTPTEERADLPARVTMPLLTLITQQSLDEDYRQAAERRRAGLAGPRAGRPWVTVAVIVAVFGMLVSTAAVQTSRNADVDDAGRATLIRGIENQRDRVARQQDRIARLRSRNSSAGDRLTSLTASGEAVEARLGRLQVATGFVAVEGEGVRVTVDDADTGDTNGIVRDNDLALLVNGLWSAGAEAISVNGQRLTVMTQHPDVRSRDRGQQRGDRAAVHGAGDRGSGRPPGQLLRHDERAGLRRADPALRHALRHGQ